MISGAVLRDEAIAVLERAPLTARDKAGLIRHASAVPSADGPLVSTRHRGWATWLCAFAPLVGWRIVGRGPWTRIVANDDVPLETPLGLIGSTNDAIVTAALALLYAATGSMTRPDAAYHLEYRMRSERLAAAFMAKAETFDVHVSLMRERHALRLYVKDSRRIGDMLAASGLMTAYFAFSAQLVDREVRNRVNRQVNCDRANARRVADTSERQRAVLAALLRGPGAEQLPEGLREVARRRLSHPELSLAELGATLSPPLGKSGTSHRLRHLMALAQELGVSPESPVAPVLYSDQDRFERGERILSPQGTTDSEDDGRVGCD